MMNKITLPGFSAHTALVLVSLGLYIAISGCGMTVTAPQTPGNMNVAIQIQDYHVGTSPIAVHFATLANDTIEFVSGETVDCDGNFLKYESNPLQQLLAYGSYVGEVQRQSDNGTYTITYTPAKSSAISIAVPVVAAAVQISQPTDGSTVAIPQNAPLVITYTPTKLANTTILAIAVDERNTVTATLPTSETGTLSIPASQFNKFQPGPGSLSLVRITTSYPGGSPFHQVKVDYQNVTRLQITWQ